MRAYLIAEIQVHDPELYASYVPQVKPLVEAFGGRYLVRGGEVTPIAGGWEPERIVVVTFPDADALQAWLRSPAYGALAPLRERATRSRAIVVRGMDD